MRRKRTTPNSVLSPEGSDVLPTLPSGWAWAKVHEVGEVKLGRQRSPEHHNGPHMRPYLRVANVYEDRIDLSDVMKMNFTPQEFETYQLRHGDILLNEGQSLEWVGRPAMYRDDLPGACFQNTLVRFRAGPAVIPAFALLIFRHYLHSQRFQKIAKWTVNIAHLGASRFAELDFPVPPVDEQQRIVRKTDELFSKLDVGWRSLIRAKAALKRYRASVLKAAVEGGLTSEWRAKNPHDEPSRVLLDRIMKERREKWEEMQLAKFAKTNRHPPKDWCQKYGEPITPDPKNLDNVPEGWCWATVDQVSQFTMYGTSEKATKDDSGVPVLRMGNLQGGKVNLGELKYLPVIHAEFPNLLLRTGDLLFNRTNSAELVGKTAVYYYSAK